MALIMLNKTNNQKTIAKLHAVLKRNRIHGKIN